MSNYWSRGTSGTAEEGAGLESQYVLSSLFLFLSDSACMLISQSQVYSEPN